MKKTTLLLVFIILITASSGAYSQQNNKKDIYNKVNNTVNKVSNIIAVFQPYLLKARQLFYDGKQLAGDLKNASKNAFGSNNNSPNQTGYANTGGSANVPNNQGSYTPTDGSSPANNQGSGSTYPNTTSNTLPNGQNTTGYNQNVAGSNQNTSGYNQNTSGYNQNNSGYNNNNPNAANSPQNYLAGQSLPVNNPASVNNDGTGNWGNQNNGLYGNCLDAMTGNVMGMGEAAQTPTAVDLLFFAPADGQNTYYIMTPGFAKNNSTAGYMTEHVSDQVMQWSDVNESEVALTRLTTGQFNQIQNNNQIQNAVRNAQNYAGYYSSVGQKLDGQVFAVKMEMDNREVYALVAVIKQMGTSGNNGYLKIKIKSTGIDTNSDGQVDANAYQR